MKHFAPPLVFASVLVAMAAFSRRVSDFLSRTLEAGFAPLLGAILLVAGMVVLVAAATTIRSRRLLRYSTVVLGVSMVIVPIWFSDRGTVDQAAVEHLHFLSYGLMTLLFFRAFDRTAHGWLTIPLALCSVTLVGLGDESVQWLLALRTGELFDVLLNVYAALCGVVISIGLLSFTGKKAISQSAWYRLGLLLSILAAGLAAFVEFAHLGHVIDDPEVGKFRSYYSRERLDRLDRDRRARWQERAPNRPYRTFEFQDYFEIEAGEHVRKRNDAMEAEDYRTAWRENRLLERYYPSFLELTELYPRFRFRLKPWDLERIEAGATPRDSNYFSDADGGRIWIEPSRPKLWSLTAAVVMTMLLSTMALTRRGPTRPR